MAAPEGDAIYANAAYVEASGGKLIEAVRHEAMSVTDEGEKHYYERRGYQRISEDNGKSWAELPEADGEKNKGAKGTYQYPPTIILDESRDILISLFCKYEYDPDEPMFGIGNLAQRTRRMYYQVSHDAGTTWTDAEQVIAEGDEFDEVNWAPGVKIGTVGGIASGQHAFLEDGTLVLGFDITHPEAPPGNNTPRDEELYETTVYGQARILEDGETLTWTFGQHIHVEFPLSVGGCGEAALISLGGDRLFNTLRCQGDVESGTYSTRFTTVSEDGGLTWTEPVPLAYEDGETVWTPASMHQFFSSSKSGKTYLLANVLPGPVHSQMPRYPLNIAEFDRERLCVIRDSVQVIQDLPEGAPEERRYTNWGSYEERGSGDLIMTLPEQPKHANFTEMTRPEEFTADCLRYRIRIEG